MIHVAQYQCLFSDKILIYQAGIKTVFKKKVRTCFKVSINDSREISSTHCATEAGTMKNIIQKLQSFSYINVEATDFAKEASLEDRCKQSILHR